MNDNGLLRALSHLTLPVVSEIHTIVTISHIQKLRPGNLK